MRIEIRGRNVEVNDDMREQVTQRFERLGEPDADLRWRLWQHGAGGRLAAREGGMPLHARRVSERQKEQDAEQRQKTKRSGHGSTIQVADSYCIDRLQRRVLASYEFTTDRGSLE